MQDPDSGRLIACEWHDGYAEEDCLPCQEAWDWHQEYLRDIAKELG